MEKFNENERLRKLNTCRHIFHPICIIKWFASEKQRDCQRCPACNVEVTVQAIEAANQLWLAKIN
jgi:hypothetical protein